MDISNIFENGPLSHWTPDRTAALRQYRSRAAIYDFELLLLEPVRRQAVERLGLKRGDAVLDIGCGTGMSFSLLEELIGPEGSIVGVEQSPDMLDRARARAAEHGWLNTTFVSAPVEDAGIPLAGDAALFHFTHDIMRTSAAVANVIEHLKPGAIVVAAGLKWAPLHYMARNFFVWNAAMRSTTTLEGMSAPWSHLAGLLSNLHVEEMLGGCVYIARGSVPSVRALK